MKYRTLVVLGTTVALLSYSCGEEKEPEQPIPQEIVQQKPKPTTPQKPKVDTLVINGNNYISESGFITVAVTNSVNGLEGHMIEYLQAMEPHIDFNNLSPEQEGILNEYRNRVWYMNEHPWGIPPDKIPYGATGYLPRYQAEFKGTENLEARLISDHGSTGFSGED